MWPFGRNKNKGNLVNIDKDALNKIVEETEKEALKEAEKQAEEVKPIKTQNSSSMFCMGVEGKFLIDGVKLFVGTVRGTAKVGDEVLIVNPGDNEVVPEDVITFDTPNVIKTKIAGISTGKDRTSVDSVTDSMANLVFDEDLDYYVRPGTVFCSNGSKGDMVRNSYSESLGNGLISFAHMDISDEVYASLSLNDLSEIARMFVGLISRNPAFQTPEMKDEISTKMNKLGDSISKAVLNQDVIYVLRSKRTGEPYLFTRNFDGPDGTIRIDPPFILIFTEQAYRGVSKAYSNDQLSEIFKVENGEDKEGIKNFLGSVFYGNGATGLSVNYLGLTIPSTRIVPAPDYEGVPAIEIPVTNPMVESLMLLIGQLPKIETDEEKKVFNVYSAMLFREIANSRFIVPMKLDGEVEKGENNKAVIKANTTISLATMPGKADRPAVRMFTDWKRMRDAGFDPKDGWSANVTKLSDMIEKFDCAINVTKPEYAPAGVYIGKEMFENEIKKYIQ